MAVGAYALGNHSQAFLLFIIRLLSLLLFGLILQTQIGRNIFRSYEI